jgi:hypothetical protein
MKLKQLMNEGGKHQGKKNGHVPSKYETMTYKQLDRSLSKIQESLGYTILYENQKDVEKLLDAYVFIINHMVEKAQKELNSSGT